MRRPRLTLVEGDARFILEDGPIRLDVALIGTAGAMRLARQAAEQALDGLLDALCLELDRLRRPSGAPGLPPDHRVGLAMAAAVAPLASEGFITPMAAVAGAVADHVLESMLAAAPLDRAHVNNGGDIAVHLGEGAFLRIAMIRRPDNPARFGDLVLRSTDGVGGVATSGWPGRSFSLGIADAVTVLARTAALADAAATVIGNAVDLPGHPAVTRVPAVSLQPDSDLGERLVTRQVATLTETEIGLALEQGVTCARRLLEDGRIAGAALHLAGHTRIVPDALAIGAVHRHVDSP